MDRTVHTVFVDIMGFADSLAALSDPELSTLRESLERGARKVLTPQLAGVLQRYMIFHDVLQSKIRPWLDDAIGLIEFSDSAYIVLPRAAAAQTLAADVMQYLLLNGVPVRIGIGSGTFARLPFATTSLPNGAVLANAPFLGTSIVRAYRAQACEAKGFRIFVDRWSTMPRGRFVADHEYEDLCPLPDDELKSFVWPPPPLLPVGHEVRYVRDGEHAEAILKSLTAMKLGTSHQRALAHYAATESVVNRFAAMPALMRKGLI